MPRTERPCVRLTFADDSSQQERDADHAYLHEKLDELIAEISAFCSYRILTDEDTPPHSF
jgi:hypothetical protein